MWCWYQDLRSSLLGKLAKRFFLWEVGGTGFDMMDADDG